MGRVIADARLDGGPDVEAARFAIQVIGVKRERWKPALCFADQALEFDQVVKAALAPRVIRRCCLWAERRVR